MWSGTILICFANFQVLGTTRYHWYGIKFFGQVSFHSQRKNRYTSASFEARAAQGIHLSLILTHPPYSGSELSASPFFWHSSVSYQGPYLTFDVVHPAHSSSSSASIPRCIPFYFWCSYSYIKEGKSFMPTESAMLFTKHGKDFQMCISGRWGPLEGWGSNYH